VGFVSDLLGAPKRTRGVGPAEVAVAEAEVEAVFVGVTGVKVEVYNVECRVMMDMDRSWRGIGEDWNDGFGQRASEAGIARD
jgi:hypothetical protein